MFEEAFDQMIITFPEEGRGEALEDSCSASFRASMPTLRPVVPKKHIIPNNKLTNTLYRQPIQNGVKFSVDVSSKGQKSINTLCCVEFDDPNIAVTNGKGQSLSEYDRSVYNAVTSLYAASSDVRPIFTSAMIYRAMTGSSGLADDAGPTLLHLIETSLDKMSRMRVEIDFSEELHAHHLSCNGKPISGRFETYLLNLSKLTLRSGRATVCGYCVERAPVLFEYSQLSKQVLTVDMPILDIHTVVDGRITEDRPRNNEHRIQIRSYLLRRIELMKGKNRMLSDSISFLSYEKMGTHHPGIYEIAGYAAPSKVQAQRLREYVIAVLDYWVAMQYIKNYTINIGSNRGQVAGITIDLADTESPYRCS